MAKQPALPEQVAMLGERIVDELKKQFGEKWDRWNEADRELIGRVAADAAAIAFSAQAGLNVTRARRNLKAQLSNLKSAGEIEVVDAMWRAVWTIVNKSLAFAVAAL